MKKLNTLDSYSKGIFKIERNGEFITLTADEIVELLKLETALEGRALLENFADAQYDDCDMNKVEEMIEDTEVCYGIKCEVLDRIYGDDDFYDIEMNVIKNCIKYYE